MDGSMVFACRDCRIPAKVIGSSDGGFDMVCPDCGAIVVLMDAVRLACRHESVEHVIEEIDEGARRLLHIPDKIKSHPPHHPAPQFILLDLEA